ncbi:MAG: hypothetical protein QOG46_771 [Pseudonocardiales bacterium]|jgi:hypothetical protein|nr:hypothetical protein [Pseudonocardiales bacterium]
MLAVMNRLPMSSTTSVGVPGARDGVAAGRRPDRLRNQFLAPSQLTERSQLTGRSQLRKG